MKKRMLMILLIIAASMLLAVNCFALTIVDWGITGPGTTGAVQNSPSDWDLSYSISPAGFSTVQWNVTSNSITQAGDYEFDWNYSGFHSWFQVTAFLTSSDGTALVDVGPVNCCSPPSGGFNYSGNYTFAGVSVGDSFGFIMGGSNFDSNNVLSGTLNLQQAPIPEPATMLLLGTGLIGLAGFSRKKFKK